MKIGYLLISFLIFGSAKAQDEGLEAAIQQKKVEEKLLLQSVKRSYDSTNKALTKLVQKPVEKKQKPPVIIYRTIYKDTCLTPQVILTMPLPGPVDSLVYEPKKKRGWVYRIFH